MKNERITKIYIYEKFLNEKYSIFKNKFNLLAYCINLSFYSLYLY